MTKRLVAALSPLWADGIDYKGTWGTFWERKIFDIIIIVVVSGMHKFVKAHPIVHLVLENVTAQGNNFF